MKIAVCDSDVEVCEDIRNLIVQQRSGAQVAIFSSAEELLGAGADFHIYFLDIKGISGMELAHAIRQRQEEQGTLRSIIIFVTGFSEHMEEAFDVQAFHYLLKPVKPDKFRQVLERAWKEAEFMGKQEEAYILLKLPSRKKKFLLKDIFYVESGNKKVIVHAVDGIYEVQGKMGDLETAFGESFYRCHRCYLVNFARISSYNQNEIVMANGDRIMLAYKKYSAFVKAYLSYAKGGGIVNV